MRSQDLASNRVAVSTVAEAAVLPEPYLHLGADRVYNPLTDRTLGREDAGFSELVGVLEDRLALPELADEMVALLQQDGWLVEREADLHGRFLLKYVSLEAHTVCNQSCYFCPVSLDPRKSYFMPTAQYESILGQLSAYKETIEAVFMISYNEPTIDPRFVDQVRMIKEAGLPPSALSNGSGLTPEKTDGLLRLGGLRFFSINISTLDREKYRQDRGGDHLNQVLRNLDYARDKQIAEQMDMVVLGTGDAKHKQDFEAIAARFADSLFTVKYFEVNDRAGYLDVGLKVDGKKRQLAGCDLVGSRPLQHLHITPHGKCVLCCQDYSESHIVGDLNESTVDEVLKGSAMRLMRRWVYGHEEAPDAFICRNCEFALTR